MPIEITRQTAQTIENYTSSVINDEVYEQPDDSILMRGISSLINDSVKKVYEANRTHISNCSEISSAVLTLKKAPRTAGGFTQKNAILGDLTPQEQMIALNQWLKDTNPRLCHTVALKQEDTVIPIWVKPPRKSNTDAYHVMIGNTTGRLKGPAYKEWQEKDPAGTEREIFIAPLDALEMTRCGGDGALLLKKGAYESGAISHDWRYAVLRNNSYAMEASVELPQQKKAKAIKARGYAPGYNLTAMIEQSRIRECNLVPTRNYEDFYDDDYDDDGQPEVTPIQILESLNFAIKGNTDPLDRMIGKLAATHLGLSEIPTVRDWTAQQLFNNP